MKYEIKKYVIGVYNVELLGSFTNKKEATRCFDNNKPSLEKEVIQFSKVTKNEEMVIDIKHVE